jgi:hypothetical protein
MENLTDFFAGATLIRQVAMATQLTGSEDSLQLFTNS